jgi:hypothetical protein
MIPTCPSCKGHHITKVMRTYSRYKVTSVTLTNEGDSDVKCRAKAERTEDGEDEMDDPYCFCCENCGCDMNLEDLANSSAEAQEAEETK